MTEDPLAKVFRALSTSVSTSLKCDQTDAALCMEAIHLSLAPEPPTRTEALLKQHQARPADHGQNCMVCGWLQAAVYHAQTGRALTADFSRTAMTGRVS